MTPTEFQTWRAQMGLSREAAGAALGISAYTVLNYEAGKRREDGGKVTIPRAVALACAWLAFAKSDPAVAIRAAEAAGIPEAAPVAPPDPTPD